MRNAEVEVAKHDVEFFLVAASIVIAEAVDGPQIEVTGGFIFDDAVVFANHLLNVFLAEQAAVAQRFVAKPQLMVVIQVRIVLQSVQQQASAEVRQAFRHFQFPFAVATKGIVVVPDGDAEGREAVAFVEVEVLHHAVAIVGEQEQQMPIDDVLEVEVAADVVGEGAVVGMNHELHDVFEVAVSVVVFDIGEVLLEIVAGFLYIFQPVFSVEYGRVLENHGEAVLLVEAERAGVEFLHEHEKPVVVAVQDDVHIGAPRCKVLFGVHLPEQVKADFVAHHRLVYVVGVEDVGALRRQSGQGLLFFQFEREGVLVKTAGEASSAFDFGLALDVSACVVVADFARDFFAIGDGLCFRFDADDGNGGRGRLLARCQQEKGEQGEGNYVKQP